jgi:hypothetical protein
VRHLQPLLLLCLAFWSVVMAVLLLSPLLLQPILLPTKE